VVCGKRKLQNISKGRKFKVKVFITGGTTGIGKYMALGYQALGAKVAVCGRSESNFIENFKDKNSDIKFYRVDVSDRSAINGAITDFAGADGIDLVIANAGISMDQKSDIPDFDCAQKLVKINVFGVLNTFEAAIPQMVEKRSGQLVAISSVAGFNGLPHTSVYCASKSFVTTLCESFAIDLKRYGITTTCICPGFIKTPLTDKNNHPMPFLVDADIAAEKIMKAVEAKKELYVFPTLMLIVVYFMKYLPRSIFRTVLRIFNSSPKMPNFFG